MSIDFDKLSEEEIALLKSLGITKESLEKAPIKEHKQKDSRKAPITANWAGQSGIIILDCIGCGKHTEQYVDYIHFDNEVGYTLQYTKEPSCKITVKHESKSIQCPKCSNTKDLSKEELMNVVTNLRNYIYTKK
jgi:hypothetical protein